MFDVNSVKHANGQLTVSWGYLYDTYRVRAVDDSSFNRESRRPFADPNLVEARIRGLIWLDDCEYIGDTLSRCTALQKLEFHFTNIGEADGRALAFGLFQNSSLTNLFITRTNPHFEKASLPFAAALKVHPALTILRLNETIIGSEGAGDLAVALDSNRTLRVLDLKDNPIGSEGAYELALMLTRNHSLTEFDLSHCFIGDDGLGFIGTALCFNNTLLRLSIGVKHGKKFTLQEYTHGLTQTPHETIGSRGITLFSMGLRGNSSLQTLTFYSSKLGDYTSANYFCNAVSQHPTLEFLILPSSALGDEEIGLVASALPTMPSLQHISVEQNPFSDQGLISIGQAIGSHKTLVSAYIPRLGEDLVYPEALPYNPEPIHQFSQFLHRNGSLTELRMGNDLPPEIQEILKRNLHNSARRTATLFMLLFKAWGNSLTMLLETREYTIQRIRSRILNSTGV